VQRKLQGHYQIISTVGEKAKAFVPAPLPPFPPIEWTPELRNKFDQAHLALGRLGYLVEKTGNTIFKNIRKIVF
jgi:hypothetical protein